MLTHAVADENENLGVIVYVDSNMEHDTGSFAHEAVHVADYVFDELGMLSQSYDDVFWTERIQYVPLFSEREQYSIL